MVNGYVIGCIRKPRGSLKLYRRSFSIITFIDVLMYNKAEAQQYSSSTSTQLMPQLPVSVVYVVKTVEKPSSICYSSGNIIST
ncbi:Protein of unknown function [Pyronema omphalodes CBS 100304]|nr:Protein of unknown function [Pyronema omphalodes CBS 100304]